MPPTRTLLALTLLVFLLAPLRLFSQPPSATGLETQLSSAARAHAVDRARAAATALLTLYNHDTGLFDTTGWWNSANAITALTDTARLSNDQAIHSVLRNTLEQAAKLHPNFLNEFYDDEGWWALAWIDAYELTHDQRDLRAAQTIFNDMSSGWDATCGGGIWWKKDRHYKNAIANELFLSVAARLALHARGKERRRYLGWATREWTWFAASGMINADHLVNDGLDDTCHNNGRTTWSYNQGVVLGGLTALSKAGKQPDLLAPASRIAIAAITHLGDQQGVLHDVCEPDCGEDGVSFKGIFSRNLAQLQIATPDPRLLQSLAANAESLWLRARTPDDRFGTVWSGPATSGNAAAQASALDALNAAAVSQ